METLQFVGSSASHFVDDISVKVDFLHLIDMHLVFIKYFVDQILNVYELSHKIAWT